MNLSIRWKISIGLIGVLVLPFISSMMLFRDAGRAERNVARLESELYPILELTNDLAVKVQTLSDLYQSAIIEMDEGALSRAEAQAQSVSEGFERLDQLTHDNQASDLNSAAKGYLKLSAGIARDLVEGGDYDPDKMKRMAEAAATLHKDMRRYREEKNQAFPAALQEIREISSASKQRGLVTTLLALLLGLGLGWWVSNRIMVRLQSSIHAIDEMARGNLSERIPVSGGDELSQVAERFNQFVAGLEEIIKAIHVLCGTLTNKSDELALSAGDMRRQASLVADKADSATANAQGVSRRLGEVSEYSNQSTTQLSSVASASEEMNTAAKSIAGNTEHSMTVTKSAVGHTENVAGTVGKLGTAAQEINQVVSTIVDIAEQTKLLALNATIEAARAGDSGRGFAVVAGEVKDLAKQTNQASSEIQRQIEGIQVAIKTTVTHIQSILAVMSEVDKVTANVATTVNQQASTSSNVAEHIQNVALNFREIDSHLRESASVSNAIAGDIDLINQSTQKMLESNHSVLVVASELSELGQELSQRVQQFRFR